MRDTSGAADQDNFMNIRLVDLGITEDFLNKVKSTAEEILAELFKTGMSKGSVEVNGCLGSRREGTLSTLASSAETMNSTGV